MTDHDAELILKAAIEFGPDYIYIIKNGGLGRTLLVDARIKEESSVLRKKIPISWEGLHTIVTYDTKASEDLEWKGH